MNSIQTQLDQAFRAAIRQAFNVDADPVLVPSQNEKFGDYQSNAAMSLAKTLPEKTNPRQAAEKIKAALKLDDLATEITIAGPGFINVRLNPTWLASLLQQAGADVRLSIPKVAQAQTVVLDYSGPNIAKQMHVGHLRSTIIGDALSRVIAFFIGEENVIRQNHIGDWGTQFGMLIAYLQWDIGALSLRLKNLEDYYRAAKRIFDENEEFRRLSLQRVVELQSGNESALAFWRKFVDETRVHYQEVYQQLGVKLSQENERGESSYNLDLPKVVEELKMTIDKETGKPLASVSEGAVVVFIDGPDKTPLIIQKSDGGYLYGTTDLAAIRYRINELHADRIIYTHDSRQAQHFSQVFRTADKASWTHNGKVKLEYAPFGTMLGEDGKPFKSRSGDTIKLKDLLDEAEERALKVVSEKNPDLPEAERKSIAHAIGIGAVKYSDLAKDRISDYLFSWDKMLSLDGNTAPYLQYAYARIKSIFRRARERGIVKSDVPISLDSTYESSLAKHLLRISEVLEVVTRDLKPHYLCTYLYELATKFSGFFENCPVLQSGDPLRSSRLALCDVTARTMGLGLDLLGIEHPEQM